jgi:hypothetical protein
MRRPHLCGKEPRQPLQLCGLSRSEHVAVKYQEIADKPDISQAFALLVETKIEKPKFEIC